MTSQQSALVEVFRDATTHKEVAGIIASHLTNTIDVREKALEGLSFDHCSDILDLGCGYGFFSNAIIQKLPPGARITGIDRFDEYQPFYLNCCNKSGVQLFFNGNGINTIRHIKDHSIDLIICSYAMYFFPEMICDIARILKKEGVFVTITHAQPHMHEFTEYVRSLLKRNGIAECDELPYETLISNFSNRTGPGLLQSCFEEIEEKPYKSMLVFGKDDFQPFRKYFDFKKSFFLPKACQVNLEIVEIILQSVKSDLENNQSLQISKDDVIYICKKPVH